MKKTILIMLLAVGMLSADTIYFGSGVPGTIEGNTFNGTNVPTAVASAWLNSGLGPAIWESIQPDSLNPAIPGGFTTDFWFSFLLDSTPVSATLAVLVDDSGAIYMNGSLLASNLGAPQGNNCAATLPNCLQPLTLDILPFLQPGWNTAMVRVEQDCPNCSQNWYGLNVLGTVDTVPEPTGFILGGLGLLGLGMIRRSR